MPRIIDMECSVPYGANVEKKPAAAPAEAAPSRRARKIRP